MKRYIRIYKNSTLFYFKQDDKSRLWNELKKHIPLKNYRLVWNLDHFKLGKPILKNVKDDILEEFKNGNNNIIRGHEGCLITGFNFSWIYE